MTTRGKKPQKPAIKAIDTVYKGYKFRSRLEARYAVFFDALGLKFEYEKEGYEFGSIRYLPDFYFPDYKFWIETKPTDASEAEIEKAGLLAAHTDQSVYLFQEEPWNEGIYILCVQGTYAPENYRYYVKHALERGDTGIALQLMASPSQDVYYWRDLEAQAKGLSVEDTDHLFLGTKRPYTWDSVDLEMCPTCDTISFGEPDYETTQTLVDHEWVTTKGEIIEVRSDHRIEYPHTHPSCFQCGADMIMDHPRIREAGLKAQQARFEHGEKG